MCVVCDARRDRKKWSLGLVKEEVEERRKKRDKRSVFRVHLQQLLLREERREKREERRYEEKRREETERRNEMAETRIEGSHAFQNPRLKNEAKISKFRQQMLSHHYSFLYADSSCSLLAFGSSSLDTHVCDVCICFMWT